MARNCPSYKTLYQQSQDEIRRLRRENKILEEELDDQDPDDTVSIKASKSEISQPEPEPIRALLIIL